MSLVDVCLIRSCGPVGEPVLRLGVEVLDDYLEFVAGWCRPEHHAGGGLRLAGLLQGRGQGAGGGQPRDVLAFIRAQRTGQRSISSGAAGGRQRRVIESDAAARVVVGLELVRLPSRSRRCGGEPGPAWAADSSRAASSASGRPAGPRRQDGARILAPVEVDALSSPLDGCTTNRVGDRRGLVAIFAIIAVSALRLPPCVLAPPARYPRSLRRSSRSPVSMSASATACMEASEFSSPSPSGPVISGRTSTHTARWASAASH